MSQAKQVKQHADELLAQSKELAGQATKYFSLYETMKSLDAKRKEIIDKLDSLRGEVVNLDGEIRTIKRSLNDEE